ncbi:MAG: nucleotidyltransferase family protein [Candidatus Schekmanbacteria bacterium]|nr:nucleotidyltransferase family protein [Candidatus Schekmanbacteria bacterium]
MVSVVLLCAGKSQRMGSSKLLLPFRGKTVIETILDTLLSSDVNKIVTVLRKGDEDISRLIPHNKKIIKTFNPEPEGDMFSSIVCGVKSLGGEPGGVMIFLGEHPLVDYETVNRLVETFDSSDKKIIIPVYNGAKGHPVILHKSLREEILGGTFRNGLKGLIEAHENDILKITVDCKGTVIDLDTPEDYKKLLEES